jgi:hypothetical protein
MARVPLVSAAYAGQSDIASGQECVNLYAEFNAKWDPQAPTQVTYYPTAGSELFTNLNVNAKVRGEYRTSVDTAYVVVGPSVFYIAYDAITGIVTPVQIGSIADTPSQVYFKDNGLVVVLVDGVSGYVIDMSSNAFAQITDPNFYGADYVDLCDTFFIFNRPGTNQFYISGSNVNFTLLSTTGAFDPLDIAAKSGFNDPIVGLVVVHREIWLIGTLTTEVWIGTGAADFYFQEVQGAYINHGSAAKYSIASQDVLTFFIQQDQQGNGLVLQGQGYDVTEISTPRIVKEFKSYITLTDAIGFCFQISDHAFYALIFPTANKGWIYDLSTKQWSEWNWTDANGNLNRPRANCCMFAFGFILVGDWQNGNILKLNPDVMTDYEPSTPTGPITRIRTFPHSVDNNQKITYQSFDADVEVGTANEEDDPQISLSWSDDKGRTYGNPVTQSFGKIGEYRTVPSWNRLGEARDRVFKLQWSTNNKTALNGAFVDAKAARH